MRHPGLLLAALSSYCVACGPDPNATLPGFPPFVSSTGGSSGHLDSGADVPAAGGTGGTDVYIAPSTGGAGGGGGSDAAIDASDSAKDTVFVSEGGGGADRRDAGGDASGRDGSGGRDAGTTTPSAPEPCSPAKEFSCSTGNGSTGNFNTTTKFCFRTMDTILGWGCSSITPGWTIKVNGQEVTCNALPLPAAIKGFYYFEFTGSAGAVPYASIWWYGNCKAIPYPPWSGTGVVLPGAGGSGGSGTGGTTGGGGTARDAASD